jgi:hypothetical protein
VFDKIYTKKINTWNKNLLFLVGHITLSNKIMRIEMGNKATSQAPQNIPRINFPRQILDKEI